VENQGSASNFIEDFHYNVRYLSKKNDKERNDQEKDQHQIV
jgi:hypothetical protein